MATNEGQVENKSQQLMHLGFVRILGIHAITWALNLYEFAKHNSGPLKPPVGLVEKAVTTVLGPAYRIFEGVPDDLLRFLDNMLDGAIKMLDDHAPSLAKRVVSQSVCIIPEASQLVQTLVHEAQVGGPCAAIRYAVAEFNKSLLSLFVKMWFAAIKIPSFQKVAGSLVPTAGRLLEKYNQGIISLTKKGHTAFSHLPSVPVDKIGNVFKEGEANFNKGITNVKVKITNVMEKGSATLSSVPVVGKATEEAGVAASTAQKTITKAIEKGSSALTSVRAVIGDATKVTDATAPVAQKTVTGVMEKGSTCLSSVPVVGEATKAANVSASTAPETITNVVEKGSTALRSVPIAGEATKAGNVAASTARKEITNVMEKFRLP